MAAKKTGIDMDRNYVTVTLCIVDPLRRYETRYKMYKLV